MEIVHQTQLTPSSCVPACIAMVTGVDQQLIIDEMAAHNGSCGGRHDEFKQWVRMGYLPQCLPFSDLIAGHGKIMLATVPSLNIEAGNHRIVLDFRKSLTVYDPNQGREGRKFYDRDRLRGFSELTIVEYCR